jgi:hypothetical protein
MARLTVLVLPHISHRKSYSATGIRLLIDAHDSTAETLHHYDGISKWHFIIEDGVIRYLLFNPALEA